MRAALAVSVSVALLAGAAVLAGEPTETVGGYKCKSSVPNWAVRRYPSGALKSCYFARDHEIDGVPCAEGSRSAENAARRRATTVAALFHPNGRLRQCQAASSFTRGDRQYHSGDIVRLDGAGAAVEGRPALFAIVYPTLIRSDEGTAFHSASRDVLAKAMEEKLGVPVQVSTRQLVFRMPDTPIQWDLLQAGIESIGNQLAGAAGEAEFHIIMEYLVGRTRSNGEQIAGMQIYIFDENGFGDASAIVTSHDPAFRRANLSVRSVRQHGELLEKAAKYAADDAISHFKPIAETWMQP